MLKVRTVAVRHDHSPAVELALPGLTEHEEDEGRVEDVVGRGHRRMIELRVCRVIGPRVEAVG